MINTLNCYPDLIRKLERKAAADRSSLEARMRRVHQLETEVDQYALVVIPISSLIYLVTGSGKRTKSYTRKWQG